MVVNSDPPATRPAYAAPALEKGLEILDLLARGDGLLQSELAQQLGRTSSELFRMLATLEASRFIRRAGDGRYRLTMRLYELAHRHPPTQRLVSACLPILRRLAAATFQSCHVCVYDQGRLLVMARAESPGPMNFGMRLGAAFPFRSERASCRVLAAFQPPARRAELLDEMLTPEEDAAGLAEALLRIAAQGYEVAPSRVASGVTEISFPIFGGTGEAIAAAAIPFIDQMEQSGTVEEARRALAAAVAELQDDLGT